jgi:hypothetical protein
MFSSTEISLQSAKLTSHIFKSILRLMLCLAVDLETKRKLRKTKFMQRVYSKYYREPPTAGPMALNTDTTLIDTPFATPL